MKKIPLRAKDIGYKSIKFDADKWADASEYLPMEFDLCYLKTNERTFSGWHTGFCWDGLKIKPRENVLFWKLNYDM